MKSLGIVAIAIGAVILVLALIGPFGLNGRGLVAAAVIIVASGLILYRRGRRAAA